MIKAHETQLDLRLPRIATVRKGAPKPEKGPGKDLEYFRLDRADPSVAAAWHEVFGQQPKTISGILPYSDPAECLNIWDELWQGKRLVWRGDGERLHVKLDGSAYVRYAPGQGPAQPSAAGEMVGKLKVSRVSRLRLLMPQLRVAGVVEIMSSSEIDADELWANLMWIKATVATLQGAPVTVFRAARQFNVPQKDGTTMPVTKHMLHMMLDGRYLDALLPVAGTLPAPAAPVAALPALAGTPVDDDAPEDGEYEDATNGQPQPATNGNTPAVEEAYRRSDEMHPNDPGPLPDDEQAVLEAAPHDEVIDPLVTAILSLHNSDLAFSNAAGAARFIEVLTAASPYGTDNDILIAADKLICARADGVKSAAAVAAAVAWYKTAHVEDGTLFDVDDTEAKQAALATAQGLSD